MPPDNALDTRFQRSPGYWQAGTLYELPVIALILIVFGVATSGRHHAFLLFALLGFALYLLPVIAAAAARVCGSVAFGTGRDLPAVTRCTRLGGSPSWTRYSLVFRRGEELYSLLFSNCGRARRLFRKAQSVFGEAAPLRDEAAGTKAIS